MNIKLEDLVNALERSDELQSCVDKENGRVLSMGDGFAENPAGREQSEEERLAEVFSVEDDWQRYIVLPDIYDELRGFMRDFAAAAAGREVLLSALSGQGGVCRFERQLRQLALQAEWEKYRRERLWELARDWCDENAIEYEE